MTEALNFPHKVTEYHNNVYASFHIYQTLMYSWKRVVYITVFDHRHQTDHDLTLAQCYLQFLLIA